MPSIIFYRLVSAFHQQSYIRLSICKLIKLPTKFLFFHQYWLDSEKPMCRQVGLSMLEPTLRFCVKFYTSDPARLEEEFTRYLFCLQVKKDLATGCIQCNENTAALMASYIVQGEEA